MNMVSDTASTVASLATSSAKAATNLVSMVVKKVADHEDTAKFGDIKNRYYGHIESYNSMLYKFNNAFVAKKYDEAAAHLKSIKQLLDDQMQRLRDDMTILIEKYNDQIVSQVAMKIINSTECSKLTNWRNKITQARNLYLINVKKLPAIEEERKVAAATSGASEIAQPSPQIALLRAAIEKANLDKQLKDIEKFNEEHAFRAAAESIETAEKNLRELEKRMKVLMGIYSLEIKSGKKTSITEDEYKALTDGLESMLDRKRMLNFHKGLLLVEFEGYKNTVLSDKSGQIAKPRSTEKDKKEVREEKRKKEAKR
jgi:hypothetical protein